MEWPARESLQNALPQILDEMRIKVKQQIRFLSLLDLYEGKCECEIICNILEEEEGKNVADDYWGRNRKLNLRLSLPFSRRSLSAAGRREGERASNLEDVRFLEKSKARFRKPAFFSWLSRADHRGFSSCDDFSGGPGWSEESRPCSALPFLWRRRSFS